KGFIERDLITGRHKFHALPPTRPLLDLPPISAIGLSATELDERIHALVEGVEDGIDDKIVRVTIRDVPRHIARELDHKTIRDYKRRALNFQLDLLRPEATRTQASG